MAVMKSRQADPVDPAPQQRCNETATPRFRGSSVTISGTEKTTQVTGVQIKTAGDQIRLSDPHPLTLFGSTICFQRLCCARLGAGLFTFKGKKTGSAHGASTARA